MKEGIGPSASLRGEIWFLYLVECQTPNHFYVGTTTQPFNRQDNHEHCNGAQFTRVHGVKTFELLTWFNSKEEASQAEHSFTQELRGIKDLTVAGSGWSQTRWPRVVVRELGR